MFLSLMPLFEFAVPQNSLVRLRRVGIFAVLLLVSISCSCICQTPSANSSARKSENSVAAYLKSAERQTETDEQRREVKRALGDMLNKDQAELRQMRYEDYTGKKDQWSIIELLQHYFVPSRPVALDEARFFREVHDPAARAAILHQLNAVNRALR
jgi:hypothetical protein